MRATPEATRILLLVSLSCMLALWGVAGTRAQGPAEPSFTLRPIGPNVWAAIDSRNLKAPAGANAGFAIGEDGVAVIDTFATTEAATQLLAEIRKLTKLPIRFVVNTHYHVDHVVGNGVFLDIGAVVIAQRNVRGWIQPENLKFLGKEPKPELKAFIESIRPPTLGYDQALELHLGSRLIQVRSFPGHTGGDSVVVIPDAKVAFGGDLFWRNTLPNMVDASTTPWIQTLDALVTDQVGYTFVPGHGEVGTAQDVTAFRNYLATLHTLVADARGQGKSGDGVLEAVRPALTAKYGEWDFFKFLIEPNIREADAELSGTKRIPRTQ